ncbi:MULTISPECIES: COX15/CtaA family protein [unclassified Photobacterium]|uniref:COX15/CtaA family protein n=1 Tax=unclassified Photobacterium TaxID=2628852 RepID=UPI001EDE9CE2|nr:MULTISPECIES: COX15/CtaA family protein [unclassified Photobacterium]MCG3864856.1 COX15/CtaA family protein [Photobacterium sp. Ph6]MCG3876265.1 COX15/CtaA family protein [Photobacterium sp. Ph5]
MHKTQKDKPFYFLVTGAFFLSLIVVGLGAYTRLTDAGLGCPDWPGCYGFISVPQTESQLQIAQEIYPDSPVEPVKAWNEMVHRYIAGSLGVFVLVITVMAWGRPGRPTLLPSLLLVVVCFQALLGMWTVTMQLMPVVVMAHLLGGFTIVSLLWLLRLRIQPKPLFYQGGFKTQLSLSRRYLTVLKCVAMAALVVVIGQIALGGWTAANYAAVVCTQLPICEGDWQGIFDPRAFELLQPQHSSYEYGVLDYAQRVSIHVTHRIGAIITTVLVLILVGLLWLSSPLRRYSIGLMGVLSVQIILGITNVLASLPLLIAVAHNVVGLVLLLTVVTTCYRLMCDCRTPLEVKYFVSEGTTHG